MQQPALLDTLIGPADLRRLDDGQLERLADEIRYRLRQVVSTNGGHLASNLGVVELTLALHRVFDFASDRLLWDVGHQAYVHKLLTGRGGRFASLRREGGLSGFPDPCESPYDLVKVGHSSTAISSAVGLAEGFRRQGHHRKTVVVVGDGALTGGMAYEGLINGGTRQGDLLVVLNDNGAFIDPPVGSLHGYLNGIRTDRAYRRWRRRIAAVLKRMPLAREFGRGIDRLLHRLVVPGQLFEELGWRYFGPVDGHDRAGLEEVLRAIEPYREPVFLHVLTRKGGGWQPSQDDPLAFHGPRSFDVDTGVFRPAVAAQPIYAEAMVDGLRQLAAEDARLVAVTAAMASGTGLLRLAADYPDRVYDVGICEQHSVAFVQGLRLAGLRPVLIHYSTFAQRAFDQVFQELVVQRHLGVVVLLDRAGLVGDDGETHHGLYDIAWSRCLPGTVLLAPQDGAELHAMLRWAFAQADGEDPAAAYLIRYPKESVPESDRVAQVEPIRLGRAQVVQAAVDPEPVAVWGYGAGVRLAREAIATLAPAARDRITLVDARFAKPIDRDLLQSQADTHAALLTIEDHSCIGGFGSAVLEACAADGLDLPIQVLGVRDELVAHATRPQQLASQGLDPAAIAGRLQRLLQEAGYGHRPPLAMPGRAIGS